MDVLTNINAGRKHLTTPLYDKRDDFNFAIVSFSYIYYYATFHYHLHIYRIHGISRNFSEDLILALLASVLRLLKLNIANNSFKIFGRAFQID
jgi:hypothetical protein